MIKVSIFSFSIFGEFSELLVNSVLLSAFQYGQVKKVFLLTPIFFLLKIIILYKYTWLMNFFFQ